MIPIRYSIPLLIIVFTAVLAVYTVHRDWESAEAVVRGEAVTRMMYRMTELQKFFSRSLSQTENTGRAQEELDLLSMESGPQFAALANETAQVLNATHQEWIGRTLSQQAESKWKPWLSESMQTIIDRVKAQKGGEVHILGNGKYVLGIYPVSFGTSKTSTESNQTGFLVVQRDLTNELARARRTVGQNTMEMVFLLVLFAILIGILVHYFLTFRLEKLIQATERFAAGDFKVRALLKGSDEVAKLGWTFDRMAEQVAEMHRNLEVRVLQRTHELAETVSRLKEEISERVRIEDALVNEKERIQVTLASLGDAVITTDIIGCIDYINPIAENFSGTPKNLAVGKKLTDVFPLFDDVTRYPLTDPVQQCIEGGKLIELGHNILLIDSNKQERSLDISVAPIKDQFGITTGVVLIFRDVTEMNRIARQLSYQASHDSMTGLINRREFERRLHRLLEDANSEESHAFLYLDLDQFKIINDTCGHFAGDELLRQVSCVLTQVIRKRDTLARLGGDEFGVLLEHCQQDHALQIAHQIRLAVHNCKFSWENHHFNLGVSIGLVPINPKQDTLASVFQTADSACYAAKESGRDRIHVYSTGDLELAQRHGEMQWIPRLQEALTHNRFTLYFQPIIPITVSDGLHYEVLLRLVNEDGELLLPSMFIPVAERYNQMQAIDRWVIRHTFALLNNPEIIPKSVGLAINLSGQSLSDPNFLEYVENEIISKEVQLNRICFEITETAAIANLLHAQHFFSALKPRGCRFALDDFGSGLSSFSYLKNLPVDYLKIDGSFVKDMDTDPIDYAMVEAINRIGQVMGIETIAEYVENEIILKKLKTIGVNYAQGYCLAYPFPIKKLAVPA